MSSEVRVIRFSRVRDDVRPGPDGSVRIADVFVDEPPVPVGHIVTQGGAWHYVLADGTPSGLSSTMSRPDLEQQVMFYHFGELPAPEAGAPALKLAV